ncbi:hypothetical protein JB92DRAFT_3110822 [Gautieria morchelliformis]|nr:hypothetical protein JB92DRAFT_3110822 [Gautieria morchelliformis]
MSTPTGLLPDITITRAAAPYGAERIDVLKQSIAHLQTVDSLKRHTARKLIEHADGIIAVLDTIKDIHPVITLAIIPFKAAMEVFASKNDNDKRVGALLIQMMDMMTPLLDLSQLNKTHKTEKMPTAENPEGLENVLKTADEHMTAANNMVDKYRKDRVMRVQRWSDKFTDLAGQFQQDKQAMLWALHSHTAHTVDAIDRKLDGVFEFMKEMFKNPTGEEKLLTEFLKKEQNKIALPGNGDEFERLYTAYYRDGVRERPRKTGIGRPGDTAGNLQEVKREAREEWGTLQTSIEDLLVENRSTFERNLKIVKDRLESEIKQVEHNIMKKLNDGHHVHIHDKEIRHLWKIMNWRVSVKTRHFTVTLHDHYLHDLTVSRARSLDGETPVTPSQASAPVIIDAADRWCLPYLGIRYLPSISEAFDDDGSGFIKVSEVNAFTDGMPQEWSLLRWIAYWNGAWPSEIFRYAQRIRQILAQMSTAQMRVRRENVEPVQNYLNVLAFAEIQSIIDAISHVVQPREAEPELQWLAKSYRAQTEKAIRDTLEKAQYHIDAPGSIVLLFGAGRIEKYLLPLLELLLSRHLDIIVFAKEYILDSRELQGAGVSLSSAFRKVWERVTVLQESFRQQKLDVNEQFKGFSCGIYSQYHYGKFVNRIGCEVQMKWYDTDLDDTYSDDGSTVDDDDELSSKITLMQPEATGPLSSIEPGPPIMAGKNLLMSDHDERTLINPGSPVQGSVHQETQLDTAPTVFHPIDQHAPEPSTSLDQLSDPVKDTKNPTFYGPFSRHLYKENVELQTDEAFPWTPLNIRFGTVPPLQMFRLAADRVLESVQLISPRLTRNYLQRRRSIRLQWLNIALRSPTIYSGDHEYKEREPSNDKERRNLTLSHHISKADIAFYEALADVQSRLHSRHEWAR